MTRRRLTWPRYITLLTKMLATSYVVGTMLNCATELILNGIYR